MKRVYIEMLEERGVTHLHGVPLNKCDEQDLKFKLMMLEVD